MRVKHFPKKYLLAADPMESFVPELDTSVLLAQELCARGIDVDYLDLSGMDYRLPTASYLSQLRVRKIRAVSTTERPCFELEPERCAAVTEYAVILQRKDPPVDEVYRGHAARFAGAPAHIVQINNPSLTTTYSEHLLPQRFAAYAIPTRQVHTFEELLAFVRAQKGETVAKPGQLFSGRGIRFFKRDESEGELRTFWSHWNSEIIVQPFLEEVTKVGDLRILVMNEKVVGSVLRLPKAGSRLANLHQGATPHAATPTPRQLEACQVVARALCPEGLYLLGLDFIGEFLSEVNITCPSAVPQINLFSAIAGEKIIIDETEKLRERSAGSRD